MQRAFNETLGRGPTRYFTLKRLTAVRSELHQGDPAAVTVTEIAAKYGSWELGVLPGTISEFSRKEPPKRCVGHRRRPRASPWVESLSFSQVEACSLSFREIFAARFAMTILVHRSLASRPSRSHGDLTPSRTRTLSPSSCIDVGRFVNMQICVLSSRRQVEPVVYVVLPRLGIIG